MPKISWPPKQLPLSTSGNWDHWCVWQIHCFFFEWSYKETCWCVWRPQGALATPGSASGFTSICPWLWSGEMLPSYWPVCKIDLILPVFLVAFNVMTTITAYHLPLYQRYFRWWKKMVALQSDFTVVSAWHVCIYPHVWYRCLFLIAVTSNLNFIIMWIEVKSKESMLLVFLVCNYMHLIFSNNFCKLLKNYDIKI